VDYATADQWPLGAGGIPRPQRGGLTATCRRWMHVTCVRAHPVGPRLETHLPPCGPLAACRLSAVRTVELTVWALEPAPFLKNNLRGVRRIGIGIEAAGIFPGHG
jgi:hypothetical protein